MMSLKSLRQYSRTFNQRFKKDDDGVVALEFAIVAVPFFALMFGTIELAIVFFLGSSLKSATFEASRLVRTGQFMTGDADEFKTQVCENMLTGSSASTAECESRLTVKVQSLTNFYTTTNFSGADNSDEIQRDEDGDPVLDDNGNTIAISSYEATTGGQIVMVRVRYDHPLTVPGEWTQLSNVEGENTRRITAISIFRNEPFGSSDDDGDDDESGDA